MGRIGDIRINNITEALLSTDVFAVYRDKTWIPVQGLRFDDLIFGDPVVLDSNFQVNGYVSLEALKGTRYTSSTTETVSVLTATDIDIDTSGNTLTLSGMVDGSKIQVKNRSTGDATLNFDIEYQNTVCTAPVTMPTGDTYDITYDLANTRWVA